ncbi:MAG TPA: FlgD immunoglobulin-like domain containing protein, partial [Pyrinomonadaceae bacterium]|nr:FlgD immunoglobulin-like domain containing protein [Pyrinomonadaceae bacterium]
GQTWVNRIADLQDELPFGEWGWKIQFLNDSVGFVSLENMRAGAILKTTDGGLTWQRNPVNDPQGNANLEGVGFADENQGWVGGWGDANFEGGFSSETSDGGQNWQNANQIGRFINRFRFFGNPAFVGYASGQTVYKYSAEPAAPAFLKAQMRTEILDSNEPEEVTDSVEIAYTVPPGAENVTINIWDRFGEDVRRLLDEKAPEPGSYSIIWDFRNDTGEKLSPDFYIYRITIDSKAESRIVRLKTDEGE